MDRGLLSDATSTDDTPTPGYMLNEIARATMANYQTNVQIQDFLVSRVQHKHHNVKFKALFIIKHVCRSGRPEFKREMQRKVDSIKECLQFKGTPDPLRGDEPNRRVRDAAREALDAIFDSQMPVTTSAVAAANRIQGMGNDWTPPEQVASSKSTTSSMLSSIVSTVSSAVLGDGTDVTYAGHPGATGSFNGYGGRPGTTTSSSTSEYNQSSSSSSSSSMAGFGNPSFRDPRQEKTWMQKASEYYAGSNKSAMPPPVTFAPPPSGSDYNYATNRGPNALMGSEQAWQPAIPGGVVPDLPQGPPGTGRAGAAASDGSYERSIIESLCEPSGLKPVPNETKLADFLNSAPSLSAELVGACLLDTLNSDAWQSRTKALMVIAQLLQANNVSAHVDFWMQHAEDVQALVHDSKAGVRTQAIKVVKLLGGSTVSGDDVSTLSTKSSVAATLSASMKTESLLDMLDEPSPAHSPHPASVPAVATAHSEPDALFAGLSIGGSTKTEPARVAAQSNMDIFSGLSAPAAMPASVNTSAISGLDLLMESPAPPVASLPAPASASVGAELFGNMTLHSAPAVPPTQTAAPAISSAFDFMDDLTAAPPAPPSLPPTVGPMNSSSTGFSFIGNEHAHSPHPMTNYAISSAFAEPSKKETVNVFQDLTQPYLAHGSTNHSSSAVPLQSTISQNPYASFPQQTNAYSHPYGQTPHMSPQYPPAAMGSYSAQPVRSVPLGSSVLAPGMLSVTAARKTIPEAGPGSNNSGFAFLGASPAKTSGGNDSFSFVTDAMRDMSK